MMTSHLYAASVLRTKPVACGSPLYDSPLPSLLANNSASLFSKPSPLSVENGMLLGSAQTRSTFGSISSIDKSDRSTACARTFPHRNIAATAVQEMHKLRRSRSSLAEFVIDLFSSSLGMRGTSSSRTCRQHSIRMSETAVFHLGSGFGLVFVLLRSSARN